MSACPTHPRGPRAALLVGTALLGLLAGCTSSRGATSADCNAAIRRAGVVYVEAGVTRHRATASGTAVLADCHDLGRDAPGIVFTPESRRVRVVALEGWDPRDVLGVRHGREVRVFVAGGKESGPVAAS